ncbi:transposase [Xanthomonas oryzae pv. oryzae KACC 10331]|uniref:Transposase n=1 Tax=Xanthomonas oryzae pv. oryzae (strain KACC10331 / KXO85) TaxID=291331 RepID=Q5H5Z6_XANOR|nr:transposase [Xanthomonas oryzae pv. oryzae KACC 10331]
MKHKLMQAMTQREANRKLGGIVQLDDAYLGGERNGGQGRARLGEQAPFRDRRGDH